MIRLELVMQTRRLRGWLTLGTMVAIPALLTIVIGLTRAAQPQRVGDWLTVTTNTTGLSMPLIALNAMLIFLFPLAVAIFAGEAVAGEAAWGSLRYALARPVSRARFLLAKGIVAAIFSIGAVAVASASSVFAGLIAFGWRPLTVIDLQHTTPFGLAAATFPPGAAIARVVLATGFVLGTTASTFAFSLLLSTLTDRPFSAVAGGVGLSLFSRALDNIPGLNALGPWLPVSNGTATLWTGFFTHPAQTAGLTHFYLVQAAYAACFLSAAFWWFSRADILT